MGRQEERKAIALTVAKKNGRDVPAVVDWAEAQELQKQFDAMEAAQAVRKEENSQWPEHNKLAKIQDLTGAIGEFIEALPGLKLVLCDSDGDGFGRLFPTSRSIHAILAQHFGIDLKKIDQEKKEMLDTIRRNNAQEDR